MTMTLRARRTRKAGRGARRFVTGLRQLNSQLGVEQIVNGADLGADLFRLGVTGAAVADGSNLSCRVTVEHSGGSSKPLSGSAPGS